MRALVTLSARFYRCPEGHIYPDNPTLNHHFFARYLDVFEEVLVVARVEKSERPPLGAEQSDGPGVAFIGVAPFSGFASGTFFLLKSLPRIKAELRHAISSCQAYFLRVPDFLGTIAWKEIRRLGLMFAVEVNGDPAYALQAGNVRHPLRPLIRYLSIRNLRAQCAEAGAASYVTKQTLQQRYPSGENAPSTYYSSIDLPGSFFVDSPRQYSQAATRLVYVGTMEVLYKAPDVLVDALAILAEQGLNLHLTLVGDGRFRPELAERVKARRIEQQVTFLGKVPAGSGVAAALDCAHLFVLASKTEGLPKAMIEAMARGLPCIGSTAGGIPELLAPEDLVSPGDALALARKIKEIVQDPARLTRMSARNLAAAREYSDDIIRQRRNHFFRKVRELSERKNCLGKR